MSFDDCQSVDIDDEAGVYVIHGYSGKTYTYNINSEPELLSRILDNTDKLGIEVYSIETKEEKFEREFRQEYKEKYGEDFEDWSW